MSRKIIFYDIDGTIISETTHKAPASALKAIQSAKENGHYNIINTGRVKAALSNEILSLGFDGFICGCGTYVEFREEVLFHKSLEPQLYPALIEDIRKYQVAAVFEGRHALYYDPLNTTSHPSVEMIQQFQKNAGEMIYYWDDPNLSFDKLTLWSTYSRHFHEFEQAYKKQFDFIDRSDFLYEMVPVGFSKASGIQLLTEHLNISHEDTYAIGDSMNDYDMLSYAKHSIAMGNSTKELFPIVSFVTKDIEEDGLFHALKHYQII